MDGDFYATFYGSPNNADVPFTGSTDVGAALDRFRSHATKDPTSCQFGGKAGAWPPATFYPSDAQRAFDEGMFCQYDFGTSLAGCNDIIANNATAHSYIGTLAQQFKSFGYPILFRPFWEPNGDWFDWARQNFTAAEYVTLWRNLWQMIADEISGSGAGAGDGSHTGNLSFFYCVNINTVGVDADITDRWPGAKYLDAMGWDGYLGTAHFGTAYKTPEALFGPTRDLLLSCAGAGDLPIGIGEMGIGSDLASPGKPQWFTDFFDEGGWLDQNAQVRYVNYFNDNSAEADANKSLCFEQDAPESSFVPPSGATAPQAAFAAAIAREHFNANIVDATTFPSGSKVPF